jgi:AraC-like DNA-binding protein
MDETLGRSRARHLERSCKPDSIRLGTGTDGLQRMAVRFSGGGFSPHRHITYGIGLTTEGVQTFRYRGAQRVSLPGQMHVLHPDETHDGVAATSAGFGYRIVYVDPDLIREALDGRALPFVPEPVHAAGSGILASLLADLDQPFGDLRRSEAAAYLADLLVRLAGRSSRPVRVDDAAVAVVRDYLDAHAREHTSSRTLELLAGIDRFAIARQFRLVYGTSPSRYQTMRRLDVARVAIQAGLPLACAAAETGFADQSHLTRQFKRAYGLTPARWARLSRAA